MKRKTVLTVLGTRPDIIKMSPLLPRLDDLCHHVIVHSGQHYSAEMDRDFFRELEIRAPDHTLAVGSRPPASQVGRIAEGVEEIIGQLRPDWVLVQGDTNTALGGALAAAKHRHDGVRLAHIEAGCRSFNPVQPEELNRLLVDRMSALLCAPTQEDAENLRREGIAQERIMISGNTIAESCLRMDRLLEGQAVVLPDSVRVRGYAVATVHRQESVDDPGSFRRLWEAILQVAARLPVIIPLHPRSRKMLEAERLAAVAPGLTVTQPVGYRRMIGLLRDARFCLTDSGGLQEEAAILGIPTLVLRNETEHRRYVDVGLHRMTGITAERILSEVELLLDEAEYRNRRSHVPEIDRGATEKILKAIFDGEALDAEGVKKLGGA